MKIQSYGPVQMFVQNGNDDPNGHLGRKGLKFLGRSSIVFAAGLFELLKEYPQLKDCLDGNPQRVGVYYQTSMSHLPEVMEFGHKVKQDGAKSASPMRAPGTLANAAASYAALRLGVLGPNITLCAQSLDTLENLARLHMLEGRIDLALLGFVCINSFYHKELGQEHSQEYAQTYALSVC